MVATIAKNFNDDFNRQTKSKFNDIVQNRFETNANVKNVPLVSILLALITNLSHVLFPEPFDLRGRKIITRLDQAEKNTSRGAETNSISSLFASVSLTKFSILID